VEVIFVPGAAISVWYIDGLEEGTENLDNLEKALKARPELL
jgi:hypothetical protein